MDGHLACSMTPSPTSCRPHRDGTPGSHGLAWTALPGHTEGWRTRPCRLRRRMLDRLALITPADRAHRSELACRRLLDLPEMRHARTVLLYLPLAIEVDPGPAVLRLFQRGCTVCVPRFDARHHRMWPVQVRDFNVFPTPTATSEMSLAPSSHDLLSEAETAPEPGAHAATPGRPTPRHASPIGNVGDGLHQPRPQIAVPEPEGSHLPPVDLAEPPQAVNLALARAAADRLAPRRHDALARLPMAIGDGPPIPLEWVDAIVLPGFAFSADGLRLGRGGGYYERLISQATFRATTIGLAFDEQVVDSTLFDDSPLRTDRADRLRLDAVITDRHTHHQDHVAEPPLSAYAQMAADEPQNRRAYA